jgi:hypothetical protein
MISVVEKQRRPMIEEYQRLAEDAVGKGKATRDGRVVGEPARLLNELTQGVAAFKRSIPSPSYFQQQFSAKFADTPGMSDLPSHGGRTTGVLYFELELYVEPGEFNDWSLRNSGDAWKLVTKAPSPDKVATSLLRSLEGKKPWQIELPKMVKMRVEVEKSGFNSYQEGYIHFTKSPDSFEVRSNYGDKWFKEAWSIPAIRKKALEATKLVGSSK